MPVTIQYENNKEGIIVTAKGIVNGREFVEKLGEYFQDDEIIQNYRYGLNDFTQVEKFNISPNQIFSLAKIHIKASKVNQNIIVGFAINKPFIYGMVRIWQGYASITGWKIHIEETLPEIQRWIANNLRL